MKIINASVFYAESRLLFKFSNFSPERNLNNTPEKSEDMGSSSDNTAELLDSLKQSITGSKMDNNENGLDTALAFNQPDNPKNKRRESLDTIKNWAKDASIRPGDPRYEDLMKQVSSDLNLDKIDSGKYAMEVKSFSDEHIIILKSRDFFKVTDQNKSPTDGYAKIMGRVVMDNEGKVRAARSYNHGFSTEASSRGKGETLHHLAKDEQKLMTDATKKGIQIVANPHRKEGFLSTLIIGPGKKDTIIDTRMSNGDSNGYNHDRKIIATLKFLTNPKTKIEKSTNYIATDDYVVANSSSENVDIYEQGFLLLNGKFLSMGGDQVLILTPQTNRVFISNSSKDRIRMLVKNDDAESNLDYSTYYIDLQDKNERGDYQLVETK